MGKFDQPSCANGRTFLLTIKYSLTSFEWCENLAHLRLQDVPFASFVMSYTIGCSLRQVIFIGERYVMQFQTLNVVLNTSCEAVVRIRIVRAQAVSWGLTLSTTVLVRAEPLSGPAVTFVCLFMQPIYDTSGCSSQGFSWSLRNRYLNKSKLASTRLCNNHIIIFLHDTYIIQGQLRSWAEQQSEPRVVLCTGQQASFRVSEAHGKRLQRQQFRVW